MPETVPRFGTVFSDRVGRRVTIVTGRDGLVARFHPTVILLVHDVAICTRERFVAHIRITLAVPKGIDTNPDRKAEADAGDNEFE